LVDKWADDGFGRVRELESPEESVAVYYETAELDTSSVIDVPAVMKVIATVAKGSRSEQECEC
jgi:hypothetical protein